MSPRAKKTSAAFLTAVTLFLPFSPALAAQVLPEIQPLNKPFGGKIIKIQACISPKGLLLTIGPPTNDKFLLTDASTIYALGNIIPGTWTLGLASPTPVNCRGNPAGIGGFSIGSLLANILTMTKPQVLGSHVGAVTIYPIYGEPTEMGLPLEKVLVFTPLGSFDVTGAGAQTLVNLQQTLNNLPNPFAVFGAITSIINGDFAGAALSVFSLFDPTGITQIITFVYSIFNFFFPKKPPSLGNGYPIKLIGTGPAPSTP